MMEPFYFGCWGRTGHYLWTSGGQYADKERERAGKIDGRWNKSRQQSVATLSHVKGWTFLGMADYTVDSRGGSNSVFLLPGTLSFNAALDKAREVFPEIVARIEAAAPITEDS